MRIFNWLAVLENAFSWVCGSPSTVAGSGKLQCICSGPPGKTGQDFTDTVTDGHNLIKTLPQELVKMFGLLLPDIDPSFEHHLDGKRVDGRWFVPCAENINAVTTGLTEDPFSHL